MKVEREAIMPFKHVNKDGSFGSLNNSLTVRELLGALAEAAKRDPSILDRAVLLSDDEEHNGYHGCYYAPCTHSCTVKNCLDNSYCSEDSKYESEHAIIIG